MLILTDKHLMFIKKTESKMKWWGANTQRQVVKFIQNKDVMVMIDGYTEEHLRTDLENKKNQEVSFNNILDIDVKEKVIYMKMKKVKNTSFQLCKIGSNIH